MSNLAGSRERNGRRRRLEAGARAYLAIRVGVGAALALAPRETAGLWIGREAGGPGAGIIVRGFGVRDLALGVPGLAARGGDVRLWTGLSGLAGAIDFVNTLRAKYELPLYARLIGLSMTAGDELLGLGFA